MRNVGRNALDLPVAALAGLAVVFVAFALPAGLLSDAIGASGLPSLLPAAAPPLGLTARIALGIGGALATFGLVFALLRLLDRTGYDTPRKPRISQPEEDSPRLRRRDVHPDAPGRRPISATRDLGEPGREGERTEFATPAWLAETQPDELAAIDEPERGDLELEGDPDPQLAFESAVDPEPAALEAPAVAPAQPVAATSSSLGDLMERLEQGLARRQQRSAAPKPPIAPQVFPEAKDDRLQSAIDSLQRLAARTS
jgi:hypothetical protein